MSWVISVVPLVFVSQIVLYREEEVLDCECDMAMVHHLLSQIPQDLPYETLISQAGDLFVQFPPSELARKAASHERYLTSQHLQTLLHSDPCDNKCVSLSCFCSFEAWQPLLLKTLTLHLLSSGQTLSYVADANRNRLHWRTQLQTQ